MARADGSWGEVARSWWADYQSALPAGVEGHGRVLDEFRPEPTCLGARTMAGTWALAVGLPLLCVLAGFSGVRRDGAPDAVEPTLGVGLALLTALLFGARAVLARRSRLVITDTSVFVRRVRWLRIPRADIAHAFQDGVRVASAPVGAGPASAGPVQSVSLSGVAGDVLVTVRRPLWSAAALAALAAASPSVVAEECAMVVIPTFAFPLIEAGTPMPAAGSPMPALGSFVGAPVSPSLQSPTILQPLQAPPASPPAPASGHVNGWKLAVGRYDSTVPLRLILPGPVWTALAAVPASAAVGGASGSVWGSLLAAAALLGVGWSGILRSRRAIEVSDTTLALGGFFGKQAYRRSDMAHAVLRRPRPRTVTGTRTRWWRRRCVLEVMSCDGERLFRRTALFADAGRLDQLATLAQTKEVVETDPATEREVVEAISGCLHGLRVIVWGVAGLFSFLSH